MATHGNICTNHSSYLLDGSETWHPAVVLPTGRVMARAGSSATTLQIQSLSNSERNEWSLILSSRAWVYAATS